MERSLENFLAGEMAALYRPITTLKTFRIGKKMKRKQLPGERSTVAKQIYEGSADAAVYIEDKIRFLLKNKNEPKSLLVKSLTSLDRCC